MSSASTRPEKPWARVDAQGRDANPALPGRRWLILAVAVAIVLLGLSGYVEQWLWMGQLDYVGIFWTLLSVQWAMGVLAFGLAFGFLWLNLRRAAQVNNASSARGTPRSAALTSADDAEAKAVIALLRRRSKSAAVLVSAGVALLFAFALFAQWDTYLRFRYGEPFGVTDPLYNVDVGFYIFHLPFYEMLQRALVALLIVTLAIVVANYVLLGAFSQGQRSNPAVGGRAASHISALLALLVADLGWGFYLGHYELLYSTMGVVYGAGYTAANVTRWALWGMVALSAAICALCVLNAFRQRIAGLAIGASVYVAVWIVGLYLLPGLFQKFIVQPSARLA